MIMATCRLLPVVVMLVIAVVAATARADVAIRECGVRFSGSGYLEADLDCSGYRYGVEIDGGKLNLRGFRLVGGEYGVLCHGSCKVSNGTVEGAREDGIAAIKVVKVYKVTVRENGFTGVKGGVAAFVERSELIGNARAGVQGLRRIKLNNVVSRENGAGANAGESARIIDSDIFDNARGGVAAARIVATRSTVTNNHTGAECGITLPCADLESPPEGKRPRLKDSTCETSHKGGTAITGESWGVCTLD